MRDCIKGFEDYLINSKHAAKNTLSSYMRDVVQFGRYLTDRLEKNVEDAVS